MNRKTVTYATAAAAALLLGTACAAPRTAAPEPVPQPGAAAPGGHAGRDHAADARTRPADDGRVRTGYTLADVRFMQNMIGHHAQALVMAELVAGRSERPDMALLAERIEVSQRDEIAYMQRWLRDRGEEVPPLDAHVHAAMGHDHVMPGMLTQQELDAMAAARGTQFDRLFLEGMIRHHEGAIVMVRELFSSPGAGHDAEIFVFASDVEADQVAEIQRMRRLLAMLPGSD
jgi:uncharacterized protein (DUF305 family)